MARDLEKKRARDRECSRRRCARIPYADRVSGQRRERKLERDRERRAEHRLALRALDVLAALLAPRLLPILQRQLQGSK